MGKLGVPLGLQRDDTCVSEFVGFEPSKDLVSTSRTATSSYPRILIHGEDQDGTLKRLGSIDIPKGQLPSVANQTVGSPFVSQLQDSFSDIRTVIQGTLRLALQSDQHPPIEVSYYATLDFPNSLNSLGSKYVNDDGTIVASSPITNSPELQPSQTNPKILAARGDELFKLHSIDGNVAHLTKARSFYFDAVHFTPDNDPYRADRLSKLAFISLNLFISTGDVSHLNEAIPIFENAVSSTPDSLPSKPFLLNRQGFALSSRYKRLGDLSDVMLAISAHENAVRLTPDNHPKKPRWLEDLAIAILRRRSNGLGVKQAIPIYTTAVQLTSENDPSKPRLLDTLGRLAFGLFRLEGSVVNINLAVTSYRDAVNLTFDDDPAKSSRLHDLGDALMTRAVGRADRP